MYRVCSFNSIHTYGAGVSVIAKWRNTNNYHHKTFIGSLFVIPLLGYSYFNCTAEKIDIHLPDHNINFSPNKRINIQRHNIIPISINNDSLIKTPLANSATNHQTTTGLHPTIWPFKLARWCRKHQFYTCALWLYSLYLLTPRNNFYHLGALESSAMIYFHEFQDYTKALEMFNRLGTNWCILTRQEFTIAHCYTQQDPPDYDKAVHWYELWVKHRLARNQTCVDACSILFTICYEKTQDWEKALYYADLLGDEYIHEKNWEFEVAMAAYENEEYDKAIEYFVLYTENAASEMEFIMIAYQNIANVYRERDLPRDALEWFLKIDEERLIKNNQEGIIGSCYNKLHDKENAVKWFELMMKNEDTYKNETYAPEYVAECYIPIALYYARKNEYKKAIEKGWSRMTDEEIVQHDVAFSVWIAYYRVGDVAMQLKYLKMFMDMEGDKIDDSWAEQFNTTGGRDAILCILREMKDTHVEYATEIAELIAYFEWSV